MSEREHYFEQLIPSSHRYTSLDNEYQEYLEIRQKTLNKPPVIYPWPPPRSTRYEEVQKRKAPEESSSKQPDQKIQRFSSK